MMGAAEPVVSQELLLRIAEAIRGIRYGSVQITIHDSRVVQIEKAEKVRLEQPADLTPGGCHSPHVSRSDRAPGNRTHRA